MRCFFGLRNLFVLRNQQAVFLKDRVSLKEACLPFFLKETVLLTSLRPTPSDRAERLLSNRAENTLWDGLWLGIGSFLCSDVDSH